MFESLFETIASGINLSAEEIDFIRSLWTPRQLRRGQFFQRAGEVATHGGFVVRGCLRTYVIDARGGESIIHFSPERTFIGDITSAVTEQPTLYAVDARWSSSSFAFFHQLVRRWRVRRCGNTVGQWPCSRVICSPASL